MSRRDDRRSPRSSHQSSSHSSRYSDWVGADLSGDIEADCDFDGGSMLVDDEDLNAAFEAEHGGMFKVIDEVKVEMSARHGSRERGDEKKKFVIPKLKRPEQEDPYDKSCSSGEEVKRDWRRSERDNRSKDLDSRRRGKGDRDSGKGDRDSGKGDRDSGRGDRDSGWREKDGKEDTRQRESQDSRGDSGRCHAETKRESWNGSSDITSSGGERQSLFETFAQQGLIPDNHHAIIVESAAEVTRADQSTTKNTSHVPEEEESGLMIPLGRDSLVFVRDYHSWQVRVHPVCKADMARSDFAQIWSMADSSSIVWSTHKDFGGVAEFLLKDYNSIQKFMRKIMWHNYVSDVLTVEVTEREKSDFSEQDATNAFDTIANKMMFKFNNTRARQMIKTFYPTPQGEVTDRSVYVNNINSGKAASLLKAVFPCSSKISVARSTAETSSALVETSSMDETFNYLVVYDQICINNSDVILSSVQNDWKGAKEKFEKEGSRKEAGAGKKPPDSARPCDEGASRSPGSGKRPAHTAAKRPAGAGGKRPADTGDRQQSGSSAGGGGLSKRSKGSTSQPRSQEPGRDRGAAASRGGPSRGREGGRGGAPASGRHPGRPLLPDPNTPKRGGEGLLPLPGPPPLPPPPPPPDSMMGMGDGLLPHPDGMPPPPGQPPSLLALPVNPTPKGLIEGEMLGPADPDFRSMELKEIQHELESRVLETRAQLETQLSKLDQAYMAGLPPKPRRPMDYMDEQDRARDAYRRPLLPVEGAPLPERQDWLGQADDYRRPMPPPPVPPLPPSSSSSSSGPGLLPRSYESGSAHSRPRREEAYADSGQGRPRPYLLEAPPEQGGIREGSEKREVYDYEHARRRQAVDSDMYHDDRLPPPPLPPPSRPALLDRDRRDYPGDGSSYGGREQYSYEEAEARRASNYRYEEDSRRGAAPRYDDYDRRY